MTPEDVDYVVLAHSRSGPPVEIGREDSFWKAKVLAMEEKRRGHEVVVETRPKAVAA